MYICLGQKYTLTARWGQWKFYLFSPKKWRRKWRGRKLRDRRKWKCKWKCWIKMGRFSKEMRRSSSKLAPRQEWVWERREMEKWKRRRPTRHETDWLILLEYALQVLYYCSIIIIVIEYCPIESKSTTTSPYDNSSIIVHVYMNIHSYLQYFHFHLYQPKNYNLQSYKYVCCTRYYWKSQKAKRERDKQ